MSTKAAKEILALLDRAGSFNENDTNLQEAIGYLISSVSHTRSFTITTTDSLTPNVDQVDLVNITTLASTLVVNNPIGTPKDGDGFVLKIKDNGSPRAISWGSNYRAFGQALSLTTVTSKAMYIPMIYSAADNKWDVLPYNEEV